MWISSPRFSCNRRSSRSDRCPGLAHAFVFWSFLGFALVTLNHCAVGLGIGFLNPEKPGSLRTLQPPLLLPRRSLCTALRRQHHGAFCAALFCATCLAGQKSFHRIRLHCVSHLCVDGNLSRRLLHHRCVARCAHPLVDSYAGAGRFSAADSAHQAPASCAEPRQQSFSPREKFSDIPPLANDEDFASLPVRI